MKKTKLTKKTIFIGELFLLSILMTFSNNSKKDKENRKSTLLQYTQQPREVTESSFSLDTNLSNLSPKKISPEFLWTIETEEKEQAYFQSFSNRLEKEMQKVKTVNESFKEVFPEIINWLEIEKKRSERIYYDLPIDFDFQDYIYDTSEKFEVPAILGFVLPHVESRGTWATNGVKSISDDYGLTQINALHLDYIEKNYGYTEAEVLNNPYINMECSIRLLHDRFMPLYGYDINNYDILDICGAYNTGNTNWRNSESGVEYVSLCEEYLETVFSESQSLTRKR